MVAQIDEQHPAMVADAMAPARQADLLADIAVAERAAIVGAVAVHGRTFQGEQSTKPGGRAEGAWGPSFVKNLGLKSAIRAARSGSPRARPNLTILVENLARSDAAVLTARLAPQGNCVGTASVLALSTLAGRAPE